MYHTHSLNEVEATAKVALREELQYFGKQASLQLELLRDYRLNALEEVREVVKLALHDNANLRLFGSIITGFCDDSSDIDASVSIDFETLRFVLSSYGDSPQLICAKSVEKIAYYINLHSYLGMTVTQLITSARIPIITVKVSGGFSIDLSINNELPLYNTALLKSYAESHECVRVLVLCVRRWAKLLNISGAKSGNLSSYGWTLLCIYFLQVCISPTAFLTSIQAHSLHRVFSCPCTGRQYSVGFSPRKAKLMRPPPNIADLLLSFFVFYSSDFMWGAEVISVRTGKRMSISEYPQLRVGSNPVHIEDPIDTEKNLNCVLDMTGAARLRDAFIVTANKLSNAPSTVILQQARMLLMGGH